MRSTCTLSTTIDSRVQLSLHETRTKNKNKLSIGVRVIVSPSNPLFCCEVLISMLQYPQKV